MCARTELERYMAGSDDPDFEAKAADVIDDHIWLRRSTRSCSAWMKKTGDSGVGPSRSGASLSPGRLERARLRISTQRYFVSCMRRWM